MADPISLHANIPQALRDWEGLMLLDYLGKSV